jgi:hypothetical protein
MSAEATPPLSPLASQSHKACPHCGGGDLISGLTMNQGVEVGAFGPVYRAAGIFRGTEALYMDLCRSCGTVARFYVKRTDRNWVQK